MSGAVEGSNVVMCWYSMPCSAQKISASRINLHKLHRAYAVGVSRQREAADAAE
jgi:hypothetical protein